MQAILELPPGLTLDQLQDLVNDRIRDINTALGLAVENPVGEDLDIGTKRIVNLADPKNDLDGVNLRTLQRRRAPDGTTTVISSREHYGIVFSSIGAITTGDLTAAYPVAKDRTGTPYAVYACATDVPVSDCKLQVTQNGIAILNTPIVIPAAVPLTVKSVDLVIPIQKFAELDQIRLSVVADGGAGRVGLVVMVRR